MVNKIWFFFIVVGIITSLFIVNINIINDEILSCGKTTIGEKIAKLLNKEFVDTDKLIEEKYGNIPSIFNNFGEETFRNYESEIINLVSARNNLVISTGGGAILRNENVVSLKHNSIICYIDRDVSLLETTGRPLSKNSDAIKELKKVREPIYKKICNFSVENNSELNSVIKKILEELKNVISN